MKGVNLIVWHLFLFFEFYSELPPIFRKRDSYWVQANPEMEDKLV